MVLSINNVVYSVLYLQKN